MSTVGTSTSTAALKEYGLSSEVGYLVFTTRYLVLHDTGLFLAKPMIVIFLAKD